MTRHRFMKPDANQAEIVAELRKLGAVVWITASLGGSVLDIVVFWRGQVVPVEIKVPGKRDALTAGEREGIRLLALVGVRAVVATCTEDIVATFEKLPYPRLTSMNARVK